MSKKYVPSGYQILNLSVVGLTKNDNGEYELPESDDVKVLTEILTSKKITKPILLSIETSMFTISGLCTCALTNDTLVISLQFIKSNSDDGVNTIYGCDFYINGDDKTVATETIFEM